ncbi:MAG: DUF1465 family protein [Alphaproteobacteria bacterium]|nr:DUF1465 family protein [Alphaproteobacteria bacterium]
MSVIDSRVSSFVRSEVFSHTFRDGMALVERTANYLDGEGREASRQLARHAALAYANASMRLTTHLMQSASWLLALRAVRDGDMAVEEAADPKYRLAPRERRAPSMVEVPLPNDLADIINAAEQLYDRIRRLDGELFNAGAPGLDGPDIASQLRSLREAFGDA